MKAGLAEERRFRRFALGSSGDKQLLQVITERILNFDPVILDCNGTSQRPPRIFVTAFGPATPVSLPATARSNA